MSKIITHKQFFEEMNKLWDECFNEVKPVAWIGETLMGRQYINGSNGFLPVGTALYTHPVKQLLTDDEIAQIESRCKHPLASWAWQLEFARAIIKEITE